MTAENDQRKLQSLMLQIRSYQATLQELARQTALTEQAVAELNSTIGAIEDLPSSKESESLFPIGAGVYLKANIVDKTKLLVSVSGEVAIEKSATEAKAYLEQKKKQLLENDAKLREQADKISIELEAANKSAEELYAKVQK